jgi:hypothetical protein
VPLKRGRTPTWTNVIRDLNRDAVRLKHLDPQTKEVEEMRCTLIEAMIPDKHMKDTDPNNPLETDLITVWDIDRYRWNQFRISQLEEYTPPWGAGDQARAIEERREDATDPRGTRHQESQEVTQET